MLIPQRDSIFGYGEWPFEGPKKRKKNQTNIVIFKFFHPFGTPSSLLRIYNLVEKNRAQGHQQRVSDQEGEGWGVREPQHSWDSECTKCIEGSEFPEDLLERRQRQRERKGRAPGNSQSIVLVIVVGTFRTQSSQAKEMADRESFATTAQTTEFRSPQLT